MDTLTAVVSFRMNSLKNGARGQIPTKLQHDGHHHQVSLTCMHFVLPVLSFMVGLKFLIRERIRVPSFRNGIESHSRVLLRPPGA